MKIEKVNDNQIRCTLTREDLANRELKISELAYGTEKAKTLFRDMMQQANFEFGFEAEDIPLMIEAIPLNAECIVLIITKVEDPEELDTRFSRFAPSVNDASNDDRDYESESASEEMMDLFRKLQEKRKDDKEESNTVSQDSQAADASRSRLFIFDSLQVVIKVSAIVAPYYEGISTLYKEEHSGKYLLVLTQGSADSDAFDRTCNVLSEYGSLKRTGAASTSFLEEHYQALIRGNALNAMNLQ